MLRCFSFTRWVWRFVLFMLTMALCLAGFDAGSLRAQGVPDAPAGANGVDAGSIELPPGFTLREIGGFNFPTDMAFVPSGDLLVLEKGTGDGPSGQSQVRVVRNGALRAAPVMTLSTNPFGDSGLLGLAVDPNFADNGYIYIWYATGEESLGWSGDTVNRLSRFTLDRTTLVALPSSELVLLDGIRWWMMHNGGGMAFDSAGALYLSIGDTTADLSAQDPALMTGKVLRITPTEAGYTVPEDNPFVDEERALPEVFALGLRNPFRMAHRAGDDGIYVVDVGNEAWEEVNLAAAGANFGWPLREGPCPLNEVKPCSPAPDTFTEPVLYYGHDAGLGASITGVDFYEGSQFPEEYHDRLFFADLNLGTIEVGAVGATAGATEGATVGSDDFTIAPFAVNAPGIVDLEYHAESLYYLQINGGKIGVITYTGIPNQLPVVNLRADVTLGPSPLAVRFDAGESYDPDGRIVEYRWNFGDGSEPQVTTGPSVTHTFAEDGAYVVQLAVADDAGEVTEPVTLDIQAYSGAIPVITLTNLTEPGRTLFHGGDQWQYGVTRAGDNDDLDVESPFVWSVAMYHNQHSHPIISEQVADGGLFDVTTDNHGGAWNIWYRFHLYMNTASGQQVHVSADVNPALVTVGVAASPSSVDVSVNGGRRPTPYRYRAIVGTEHTLEAPEQILTDAGVGVFDYWHVHAGGWPLTNSRSAAPGELTNPLAAITVPAASTSYTAYYRYLRPADKLYLPLIAR